MSIASRGRCLSCALLWALLLPALARHLPAQSLTVSVRDSAGQPLQYVSLTLIDARDEVYASARTGANGIARMLRADAGTYTLLARRFGFRPERRAGLLISPGDTVAVRITLERLSLVLDPILVRAQRDTVRRSRAFGINLRATGGQIITPTEIDRAVLGARDLADVLARQPLGAMRVDQYRRCLVSNRGSRCLPAVVDGQLFYDGTALNDFVLPEVIDYMVVLRGSEVGVRYGSIGMNGIILIATKRDWRRGPP